MICRQKNKPAAEAVGLLIMKDGFPIKDKF